VRETGVAASCAALTPAARFAAARLVFVGRMLPGPTARLGRRRVLGSPARLRVTRYLKGRGPRTVAVETAVRLDRGGITGTEDGIESEAGQRWKIYTTSRQQPFATSICAGSGRVTAQRSPSAALALWRGFPVHAMPRPIVPLGEGLVLEPVSGFHTGEQKLAYLEGRFALGAALPPGATRAYGRLRAHARDQHADVPPLTITAVRLGSATFDTDRGRRRLPAWNFSFRDVDAPASVLALDAPKVFVPPPLRRLGPAGPGNSIEDSAKSAASGRSITISFPGAPAGTGPCEANYRASAVGDPRAVAFTITTIATPVGPGQACPALAVTRSVVLHLTRPLRARVLVSATDGGAVAVTTDRSPAGRAGRPASR
jgi:hypothetical protein